MTRSGWKTLALPAAAFTVAAVALITASVNGRPAVEPAAPPDGRPALTTADWEPVARAGRDTPVVTNPSQTPGSSITPPP